MKNGWPAKRLNEVCEIVMGTSPPGDTYNTTGQGIPLINGPVEFGPGPFGKTVRTKFTTAPNKLCKENDLILCVRGSTTGKMNIAGFDACIGRGVAAIRAKEYQPWINYFVCSKRDDIYSLGTGATFPNISTANLADLKILVPPLPEQRRIVGILDEAFDGIATAKANAERNLQNARALFESHLNAVFTQRGEGWVEKQLNEVCEVKDGTHYSPKYMTDGVPFVTQKNVREEGLSFANTKFISAEDHADFFRRSNVTCGDILISMIGVNRGMACIVDDKRVFSIKNVGLVKRNQAVNQQFLLYYLKSSQAGEYVRTASKGGAQEFLGLTELRRFPIPLPPLIQQNALAGEFQAIRTETQRLESLYQRKLAALDELKKSLLHQAFSGEL